MVRHYAGPVAAIALRGGSTLGIYRDHIEAEGQAFGIQQLTRAAMTVDPDARAGQPAAPAVGIVVRNGKSAIYIPADPPDAQRALEAIYTLRPDLRSARGSRDSRGLAVARQPGAVLDSHERIVAVCAHLSVFVAPLLLPLIFWLATRQTMAYASRQARQAFIFHLSIVLLIALDAGLLFALALGTALWAGATDSPGPLGLGVFVVLLGGLVALGLVLAGVVFSVIAAIQVLRGQPFSYPFLRRA
ncbi:MAG TPA: DUF4870 domain-containing protein [Ktedonobacterales bacterium]|jgi:uncharacterized Tic20 family protein|nr:DUF4870 domain-containing protein [Ktedonobacterales bacterium]